jgi:Protein of unknown function (DUF1566)
VATKLAERTGLSLVGLGVVVAVGCGSGGRGEVAAESTGGAQSQAGHVGSTATAGVTGGGTTSGETAGVAMNVGGASDEAGTGHGGTATGGVNGGAGHGGTAGGGGANGGDTNGGAGGGVTWTAADYASRKWARWSIPNPPSLSLPHPMSYTVSGDLVTDKVTGLVWQKSSNAATTNWQAALDYCASLGDGFSLPTRIELTSILDNARAGGKVDPAAFSFGKAAGWTWASTPWVVNERKKLTGAAALSWFINFAVGDSNNSLSQTATSAYARCVRVPATQALPASHYAIASGEVTDNYTGLVWQQAHASAEATLGWEGAGSYCGGLALNGKSWRVPSLNELASIVDDVPTGNVSPAVDHDAFPSTGANLQYWSASPYGTSTTEHWTINFEDGFTAHRANATLGSARCVR